MKTKIKAEPQDAETRRNEGGNTKEDPVEILLAESLRYHNLSQSVAAHAFKRGDTDPRTARLIRDHEIRSETMKAAASLIRGT